MSDARLRQLERRWRESGAEADLRRWLHERVRQGETSWSRLALAGHLGHPLLRELLGMRGRTTSPTGKHLKRWCLRLRPFGREAWVRVAVGAAEAVQPTQPDTLAAGFLGAARSWAACPCPDHAAEARRSLEQGGSQDGAARRAAYHAAEAAAQWVDPLAAVERHPLGPTWEAALAAAGALGEAPDRFTRVREAVRERLLPWALGE